MAMNSKRRSLQSLWLCNEIWSFLCFLWISHLFHFYDLSFYSMPWQLFISSLLFFQSIIFTHSIVHQDFSICSMWWICCFLSHVFRDNRFFSNISTFHLFPVELIWRVSKYHWFHSKLVFDVMLFIEFNIAIADSQICIEKICWITKSCVEIAGCHYFSLTCNRKWLSSARSVTTILGGLPHLERALLFERRKGRECE